MASKFGYLVLQRTVSATERLRGNQEFEDFSPSVGVKITGYHANSGKFKANQWQESCHLQRQRLIYSSTHAHFKNGVAEGNIRLLQDLARTMMAEAQIRWPQAISTILWPYAMHHAQHNINHTPSPLLPKKNTPFEAYTSSRTRRHTADAVPFGCPVYTTKDEICDGLPYNKWKLRATLGLYLGISPIHSRRSGLILN